MSEPLIGGAALTLLVHFQVDNSWVRSKTTLEFAMIGVMPPLIRLVGETQVRTVLRRPHCGRWPSWGRSVPMSGAGAAQLAQAEPARDVGRTLSVLHLVGSDKFAGTERHVLGLMGELRALGCEVELACPRRAGLLRREAAEMDFTVRSMVGVARSKPDIIHIHDGAAAVVGWLLARRGQAALVRTQHFVSPASATRTGVLGLASRLVHRRLNRRLDGYVCVSEAAARAARNRRDASGAQVAVIPPGVHLASAEQVAQATTGRARSASPIVASAGRLELERRFDVLLEAIPIVLQTFPDCRFVIAGRGKAAAELRARAAAVRADAAVEWTGWLPDISPVLSQAHVYVNTWPDEGFGMATAEAMGYGLPVIVADSGASPELIEDKISGRVVPALSTAALAATICELLGDRPRAAAIGVAARERALARYSARATGVSMLAFYRQLPSIAGDR